MPLSENISMAFTSLFANKMRALLTMLGIIIGIGSVIAVMTVGGSLTSSVNDTLLGLGANNITVGLIQKSASSSAPAGPAAAVRLFRSAQVAQKDLLTQDMLNTYRDVFHEQVHAVGYSEPLGNVTITQGKNKAPLMVQGVNPEYDKVQAVTLLGGRFLTAEDEQNTRKVAVVSDAFCKAIFPGQDPLGRSFDVRQGKKFNTFYIVGVYEYKSAGQMMITASDETPLTTAYVPYATAKKITGTPTGYSSFTVVSAKTVDTQRLLAETQAFFARYYARNPGYTVTAMSMESLLDSVNSMMNNISVAIAIIAGISLMVGGIGVMNIMLVSITERTREIGVRKALGATNGNIRLQFIVEAVIICLVGGIIGIVFGLGLGSIGVKLLGYAAMPSIGVILFAFFFSMGIGVFFGYYPANKAARLDPIEALRYE